MHDVFAVAWHINLILLVHWILIRETRVYVTSAYRQGDDGVHGQNPLRGLDIRFWIYANPEKLVEHINELWVYDPARPNLKVALLHGEGSNKHIHLQVHNSTKLREV